MQRIVLMTAAVLFFGVFARAEENKPAPTPVDTAVTDKKADNSARNKTERENREVNAIDQNENKADLEITRKIRRAIMEDKNLSTYAQNVKIITQDGVVSLKGPVRSDDEKKSIEEKATQVAGAEKVKNQLEIAPKNP